MGKMSRLLLLASLITGLSGCAASRSSSARLPDVTGTWMGGTVAGIRNVTLHLQQTGTNVTGTVGGLGVPDGPISGVLGGDTIQLSAERAAFAPRLVVRGDVMSGEVDGVPMNLIRLGPAESSR